MHFAILNLEGIVMKKCAVSFALSLLLLSFPFTARGDASTWEVHYYADEFKQPTEEAYIINGTKFAGEFSNSGTTNATLLSGIFIDKDNVTIMLFEYGHSHVKNARSDAVRYTITMKTEDHTKTRLTGAMYSCGDRIYIDDRCKGDVIRALSGKTSVSFYIAQSDRPTTTYLFTVPASNFSEAYQCLK